LKEFSKFAANVVYTRAVLKVAQLILLKKTVTRPVSSFKVTRRHWN